MWYLAHCDGSVHRDKQQVLVVLFTPDPYLAKLFKEVFGKYGYVGVAPYRDSRGRYKWQVWVRLPLKSFQWLLEKRAPAPLNNNDKLYEALSMAIDCEGSICAYNPKGRRTTRFVVEFFNEKPYVVEPLYGALRDRRYEVSAGKVPRSRRTNYGSLNDDY